MSTKLEQAADNVDSRYTISGVLRPQLNKVFPTHWSFMLGEMALYSFIILLLTGIYLALFFDPSITKVIYDGAYLPLNGVEMSRAYATALDISFDVHLADKQAAAHVKGNIKCRCVGARHLDTVERQVRTVINDLGNGRVKEQCQVNTSQQKDDEAVQRHLTEHEGPVAREHLVELSAEEASAGEARISVVRGFSEFCSH